jgi:hypothetical protein
MFALIAGEFAQAQSRWRARGYLLGLLSRSERKNSWTIAEFAGDASLGGIQRLLNFYCWDAGAVRDALAPVCGEQIRRPGGGDGRGRDGFHQEGPPASTPSCWSDIVTAAALLQVPLVRRWRIDSCGRQDVCDAGLPPSAHEQRHDARRGYRAGEI